MYFLSSISKKNIHNNYYYFLNNEQSYLLILWLWTAILITLSGRWELMLLGESDLQVRLR